MADEEGLAQRWENYLGDPANRAMMMQMGAALMQPVGLGQTPVGHVGQAIGQGGEAQDRVRKAEIEERELVRREEDTSSKMDQREGALDMKGKALDIQGQRVQLQADENASKDRLRTAQAEAEAARAGYLTARIQQLEQRIALEPADFDAKRELIQARSDLARAQVHTNTLREQTRAKNVDSQVQTRAVDSATRQQNANTRAADVGSKTETRASDIAVKERNAGTRERAVDTTEGGMKLSERVKMQGIYTKEKIAHEKNEANRATMERNYKPTPFMPFPEWLQGRRGTKAPATSQSPAPPSGGGGGTRPASGSPGVPTGTGADGSKWELRNGAWVKVNGP